MDIPCKGISGLLYKGIESRTYTRLCHTKQYEASLIEARRAKVTSWATLDNRK